MSLFWYQYHAVLITVDLQYSLKSGSVMLPALFFLLRIDLAMWAVFWFQIKFNLFFFQFYEEGHWWLDGGGVESINYFGQMAIFTMLILPNNKHGNFFHLFVSSLISLSSGVCSSP